MNNPPKTIFVNPPVTKEQRMGPIGPVIKNLYFNSPPLGIAYLAAVLEKNSFPVQILDAAVEELDMEETVEIIRASQCDVLGLTSTSNFFCNALELAARAKKALPKLITVIGGPHATRNYESTAGRPEFDYVCVGEGEETCLEFLETLRSGGAMRQVRGLAYQENGKVLVTEPRPLIQDMDSIPMPARRMLPLKKYVPQPNDGPFLPKFAMITSRGCPYGCIFCDHGAFGNKYRSFSAKRIVAEMRDLIENFGAKDIAFVDSLFMSSEKRVNAIVEEITAQGVKTHWTCTIRANIATREVMERMKQAGCWRVRIGVESGNERVLEFIQKKINLDQVRRTVTDAHELGLNPKAFFMIGHPTETAREIRDSIGFARSLPLTDITVQINTPLPGAPQSAFIEKYGAIVTNNLEKYSFWEPVFIPHGMTREEMDRLYRLFYRSFYLRPSVILRHMKMIRNWDDIRRYFRALRLLLSMFVFK